MIKILVVYKMRKYDTENTCFLDSFDDLNLFSKVVKLSVKDLFKDNLIDVLCRDDVSINPLVFRIVSITILDDYHF